MPDMDIAGQITTARRGHQGGLWAVFSLDLLTLGGYLNLYRWKSNFLSHVTCRIFLPFLSRMRNVDLRDPFNIESLAEHITRFSRRGVGCGEGIIAQAPEDSEKDRSQRRLMP